MLDKIAIVGQGYVGLPLAMAACSSGFKVVGIDENEEKVQKLNSGISGVEDIDGSSLLKFIHSGSYIATTNYAEITNCNIILICVPTPLTNTNLPDLSALDSCLKDLSRYLSKETLVILESTVEPGTTRNYLVPKLEFFSGINRDCFHVAFSPERIDPRNRVWNIANTPKIVSGLTKIAAEKAANFYTNFIESIITVESLEIAETAKLLENSFRLVNISFINEISVLCNKLDISIQSVIQAAATKPYGFMPFYPSIGVGGHCIPVDPMYLVNKAREIGAPTRFIELADQINQEMPGYFVSRAEKKVGGLKSKKILVVGVAYKPNVSDVRESPVGALISGLKQKGARVFWHDDLVQEWNGEKSSPLSSEYDLAILATSHDYIDLTKLGDMPILNSRESI
jgi:UDP-N-acetyl-D-glucosamine dehydrogenase